MKYEKFLILGWNSLILIHNFNRNYFCFRNQLTCENLMEDLNGLELSRWKKLKRKSLKTFMEKTANANLTLKASSNVGAIGMRKLP